jgi:type I restriction enzyme, S subunit
MHSNSMPRNEVYRKSGAEWLAEIPASWKTRRLKFVVKILKRIAGREGPDILSITQKGIKVKDVESGEGQLAMDYSNYQYVYTGDFAMNHMDLVTGYVDISPFDGVTSPDYRVFRNCSPDVLDRYLLLLFQLGYQSKVFFRYGQGVSFLGRWRFPAENFNNFTIPVPSLSEQDAIVQFTYEKTAKIDEAIEIKKQQIELLKERKQIIIQEAVTKGLNPDARMKGSEVDHHTGSCHQGLEPRRAHERQRSGLDRRSPLALGCTQTKASLRGEAT